jgi:hypothetical protein
MPVMAAGRANLLRQTAARRRAMCWVVPRVAGSLCHMATVGRACWAPH